MTHKSRVCKDTESPAGWYDALSDIRCVSWCLSFAGKMFAVMVVYSRKQLCFAPPHSASKQLVPPDRNCSLGHESLVICLPLFTGSCSYSKLPFLLVGKTHWKTRSDSPKALRSQLFHHRCSSRDPQHGPRQQTFMLTSTCISSANIIEAEIQVLTLGNRTIHGRMFLYLRALGLIIMYQWETVMNHVENSSTCGLDALQSSTNAQAARPQCLARVLGEI